MNIPTELPVSEVSDLDLVRSLETLNQTTEIFQVAFRYDGRECLGELDADPNDMTEIGDTITNIKLA